MSYQQGQQPQSPYGQPQSGQLQWNQQPPPQFGQPQQQPQWQQPPNQPAPQPPKKRGVLKWVLIAVGIMLVAIIGLCAVISAGINSAVKTATKGTISSTDTPSNNSSGGNNSSGQVAKVGQTITVNGFSCTLLSVKKLASDEIVKPKPGNEFIVVHVKLNNGSSDEKDYSPIYFHVRSGAGNITDEEIGPPSSYTANNELNSGKLSAGGSVEGDIIFQVPTGDHKAQLTWQPNILGNSTDNAWNLGL